MSYEIKYPYALASVFIWIGLVSAISFMEAWLKFKAPGITLPLGLGIGKIVFNALNKVEWTLSIVVLLNLILARAELFTFANSAYFVAVIILTIQTFLLLPKLNSRADLYISNQTVPESNIHLFYVVLEIMKVICLFIYAVTLFKVNN